MTPEISSSPNLAIPDNDPVGVSNTINVPYDISTESVRICFSSTDHTYRGDLDILLTSPLGTESQLATPTTYATRADRYDDWCFNSVRDFGEQGQGVWTLQVSDRQAVDTGTFQSWSIQIYGTTADTNTITASAAAGGTIVPVGAVAVGQGWDQAFTITPNSGYAVADVVVDGVSAGAQSSYTFSSVTADHTIAVSFAASSSGGSSSSSGGGSSGGCFIEAAWPHQPIHQSTP